MEQKRKPWQKLLALGLGLATLIGGVTIVAWAPVAQSTQVASCYTTLSVAAATIVTAYIGGNVAEHSVYQKAKDKIISIAQKQADKVTQ